MKWVNYKTARHCLLTAGKRNAAPRT
jgi:hypothetical protein